MAHFMGHWMMQSELAQTDRQTDRQIDSRLCNADYTYLFSPPDSLSPTLSHNLSVMTSPRVYMRTLTILRNRHQNPPTSLPQCLLLLLVWCLPLVCLNQLSTPYPSTCVHSVSQMSATLHSLSGSQFGSILFPLCTHIIFFECSWLVY